MKFRQMLFACALAAGSLGADEILTNRDFARLKDGMPVGWTGQKNVTNPTYRVAPGDKTGQASVVISSPDVKSRGVMMFRADKSYPAGSLVTISGEYRTSNVSFGTDGKVFVSLMCRTVLNNDKQPKFWLNAQLKPADQWTKFKVSKRLSYSIESIHLNAALWHAKGEAAFRDLSLDFVRPSTKPDGKEEFAWREAEDIDRIQQPSNWGHNLDSEYFSGKGGIMLEKKSLDWNFQITPVVNPDTLFEKDRTWHLWARVYGYLDSPRIMIYRNDRFMSFVDTPANEKTEKGAYAGPGKYVWVLCGSFTTKGGAQYISFRPQGRMMLDALFITTDAKFAPTMFEVKKEKQAPVMDVTTAHMIKAEYAAEGVSDKITLPLSFRIAGKNLMIKENQKPAVFHFSLPEHIRVEGVSSHWAGTDWNVPGRWGKKYMTFRKTATRTVNGKRICDYEIPLYYLSSNQYLLFLRADSAGFKNGGQSVCEYYLEHDNEKQLPEKITLRHIDIKPTTPFKNIYIGASYVPFNMMYRSWPEGFRNMNACGFNYIGSWHVPSQDPDFDKYRNAAFAKGFMMAVVVPQYTGIRKQDVAIGLDGKPIGEESGSQTHILTLALGPEDPPIKQTLERTKLAASTGVSIEFDDEMTNVLWDKIDYAPATKKLFREWLGKNAGGVAYKEPELIVRDKANDPKMYRLWVDFKCSRMAYWYSLYRKAFDEGVALAGGKYPASMKPMMLTCIQGAGPSFKTAEMIKESNYFDYRLLNKYCDLIQIMAYTYGGVGESAKAADALEMYNRYLGKNNTVPILLAGGYGTEVTPENKVMLKYQLLDSLMQKPKMIVFYAGATVFNPPTLAPVVEAIRIARPYEDFFVRGEAFHAMKGDKDYLRLKALKFGNKVLLYAANYADDPAKTVTVTFTGTLKSVLECATDRKLKFSGKSFSFDFKSDRGKLFLVEL